MKIEIIENVAQAEPNPEGGNGSWSCSYRTGQKFVLNVQADPADVGQEVGLTQTLWKSDRIAFYEGGGQLKITPGMPPPPPGKKEEADSEKQSRVLLPCLDGDPELIPWYNQSCKGTFATTDRWLTLTLEDSPQPLFPRNAKAPHGIERTIQQVQVSESFLVTLYKKEGGVKIKQWLWEYSYSLEPSVKSVYAKPVVVKGNRQTAMVEIEPMQGIVVAGPTATESPLSIWTPGWAPWGK